LDVGVQGKVSHSLGFAVRHAAHRVASASANAHDADTDAERGICGGIRRSIDWDISAPLRPDRF